MDLALAEKVDLFLVAGDLFDSNTQPRRSVDRVAAELARLAQARIRTVIIPGTHDVYDRSSIYRAYDLAALAGTRPAQELVTVLTPDRPWIHLAAIDAIVHGPVFATKRAPRSPLRDLAAVETPPATWKIGILHAAIAIPGRTDNDEVVITTDEIARQRSRLPRARPLALGADRQGRWRDVRLRRRAGAGRGGPGPRRQGPARDPGRARRPAGP